MFLKFPGSEQSGGCTMCTPKSPLVGFRFVLDGIERIGWGYLVVVNGEPWLAAREEDAKKDPRLAKLLSLDPRLLEEKPTKPGERKEFLYCAVLWESEQGYRTPPDGLGHFQRL
jgi:hypothetical protein